MTRIIASIAIAGALLIAAAPAQAQGQRAGTGPVGRSCAGDLATYCAGVRHGTMEARNCLEANRPRISGDCRRALDTTGGGRGMGRNRSN